MTNEEKKYLLIERYIFGELKEQELRAFQKEMELNPEFASEVKLHNEVHESIFEEELEDFRNKLNSISHKESRPKLNWRYMAACITILSLLYLGIHQLFFRASTSENIFETYFYPYEDILSERNLDSSNLDTQRILHNYNSANYKQVVELLNNIDLKDKPLLNLYLGISYIKTDSTDRAHMAFNQILSTENFLHSEAVWFDAMTYLKEGNREKAKERLKSLILQTKPSNFKNQATELLKRLE